MLLLLLLLFRQLHEFEFWVVTVSAQTFRGGPVRHSAMSSPSRPHAHGEHTTHKEAASNAVEALPSMPHAHEKHCQSCDEVHLAKLQKFLAAIDRDPKRLEKVVAARRRWFEFGLPTPNRTTSSKTSNQARASFVALFDELSWAARCYLASKLL